MKKRIFSMLVAICLVLSMIPTVSGTAFASTTYVSDSDVTYEVDGGNIYFDASTGTITGCDKRVTSAEIPDSVTGIAANAFGGCSNLQYIVGKKASYAEQYANENNIPFVAPHTHCVCGAEHKNIGDHTAETRLHSQRGRMSLQRSKTERARLPQTHFRVWRGTII